MNPSTGNSSNGVSIAKPAHKPASPLFSTGPTRKRPGWTAEALETASLGRSHRATHPKSRIKECIARIHRVLQLPDDYITAIVPGSDTGAVEMAMWSLLGRRGVDVLGWEAFGKTWMKDALVELKLDKLTCHEAPYGALPNLSHVNFEHDVVFPWNGTASGVKVPDGDWIPDDRVGLTICDATSACFAMKMPWHKLDVVTFSFQKGLGGEGGHGVLTLSPRAVERVNSYAPPWPVPKVFKLHKNGGLDSALFEGATINTPSLLVIEDAIDALSWAEEIGGIEALLKRVDTSFAHFMDWVGASPHFEVLARDPVTISSTALCLVISDAWFTAQPDEVQAGVLKSMLALLEAEDVAVDINAYRNAPAGLRIWGGPTVDPEDIASLLPWLDWAYETVCVDLQDGSPHGDD